MKHLAFLLNPVQFLQLVWKNLRYLRWKLYLLLKGVTLVGDIIINGKPIISMVKGSIRIGNNVTLRSHDRGHHTSIYAPVRLMTDTTEEALIEIGDNTRINGASVHASEKIIIGKNCLIAANVTIIDSDGHGADIHERSLTNPVSSPVIIGDNVWIGISSIILKGVRIGNNSIIGAGSVVTKDIPSNCVAAGNPVRVVKTLADKNG